MDPREIIDVVSREIALNGNDGMSSTELWPIVSSVMGFKIDVNLRSAVEKYIINNTDIILENNLFKTSEDSQWMTLTGAPKNGNSIGQKAFELLCAVAKSRSNGMSTVQAAKDTGQDLRSLFGRQQTLLKAKLIAKYPIIESGVHTNMLIYHTYMSSTEAKPSETHVNKQEIYAKTVEFIKNGHNSMRLMSEVTTEMSKLVALEESRKKPAFRRFFTEMELYGCIRRIRVSEPNNPGHNIACLEYVKDYKVEDKTNDDMIGLNITFSNDWDLDDSEEGSSDCESDESDDNEDEIESRDNAETENIFNHGKTNPKDAPEFKANLILPLGNQIQDLVRTFTYTGTSIMEISKQLTGKRYKKCLAKYLESLTTEYTEKPDKFKNNIEHLSLVKGVDFNKRVKFYRYFSKPFYLKLDPFKEGWGNFPNEEVNTSQDLSLRKISDSVESNMLGSCSIVKTSDETIKPSFHGEKVQGVVILHSCPGKDKTNTKPKKKIGRPRKKPLEPKIQTHDQEDKDVEMNIVSHERIVPLQSRTWSGGSFVGNKEFAPSRWMKQKVEKDEITDDVPQVTTPNIERQSVGSIALQHRIDIILNIVSQNNGVCQGGTYLLDLYNSNTPGDQKIDRKTMSNVCQKLINDGRLEQIFFNVTTFTGANKVKTLFIDPSVHPNKENNPVIEEAKRSIISQEWKKRSNATKQGIIVSNNFPLREVSQEDFNVIRPPRIKNTKSRKLLSSAQKSKTHYGPSASDVLGIDSNGEPLPTTKKARASHSIVQKVSNNTVNTSRDSENAAMLRAREFSLHIDPSLTLPVGTLHDYDETRLIADSKTVDLKLLAKTVIVSRSLFNEKLSSPTDWKLISQCISHNPSQRALKRLWSLARKTLIENESDSKSADILFKKVQEFEDMFMYYFERGEVDYPEDLSDKVSVTKKYVDWWINKEKYIKEHPQYLENITDNDVQSKVPLSSQIKLEDINLPNNVIDPFLNLQSQSSIVNAEKILMNTTVGVSFTPKYSNRKTSILYFSDAEMQLRAMIAADESSFDPHLAALELSDLNSGDAEEAKQSLVEKRVIKWGSRNDEKIPTGRPYVLSDYVMNSLSSKIESSLPLKALESFTEMENLTDRRPVIPTISDSEVMVLLEFATHGLDNKKAKLHRVGEKMGLLTNNYKSRGIDKQEFECGIEYSIDQDSQKMNVENEKNDSTEVSQSKGHIFPPYSGNSNRPFIWQTRFLKSNEIWYMVVLKIISTVLFRPGITYDVLQLELSSVLISDEIRAAVDALRNGGALTYTNSGALIAVPDWFRYISL